MNKKLSYESPWSWALGIPTLIWILWLVWPAFAMAPGGLHFIRQTDSLSFILSYLDKGAFSFSPATLNLSSEDGKAACEFPILYYVAARLASLGFSPAITLKSIHFLIFSAGVLYITRLLSEVTKNVLAAGLSTLLIFSSTILIYYSNNLLPDLPALGLTLIGVSLGISGILRDDKSLITKSSWFFLFATLLKITYGIYPVAICATWFFKNRSPLTGRLKQVLLWISVSIAPSVAWGSFVNVYNETYHSAYFLTIWSPIWSLNSEQIATVLDYIFRFWRVNFYYPSSLHLFGIVLLTTLALRIKKDNALFALLSWTLTGSLIYFLLFFEKFKDHDYYLMVFIPGIVIMFCTLWQYEWIRQIRVRITLIACTGIIAILSMNYAGKKLQQRFSRPTDQYNGITEMLSAIPMDELNKIGLDENVLVLGDYTMNGSLTLINRWGITVPGSHLNEFEIDEIIQKNDISKILVIGTPDDSWQRYLKQSNRIGGHGKTDIYEFIGSR